MKQLAELKGTSDLQSLNVRAVVVEPGDVFRGY